MTKTGKAWQSIKDACDIEIDFARKIGRAFDEWLDMAAAPITVFCMTILLVVFLAYALAPSFQ